MFKARPASLKPVMHSSSAHESSPVPLVGLRVRCPHCKNPIEVVELGSEHDVLCPSCGSSFNLIAGTETITERSTPRRIQHFELVRRLGMGAFGEVWQARDTILDRVVAVKIPRKGEHEPHEAEQFLREARAAAQLKHPSIVSIHEVGRFDDRLYIVSDCVQGVTLADWLTAQRPTPSESAGLVATVADAVHHAHESGVIHRDLKPGNILIDAEGQPHLTDFGLAKRDSGEVTMTVDGQILGTPAYMSPEQARGDAHKVDRRSDIYSLGVLLFELFTGERPFRGNSRMLLHQVIHDEPRAPRSFNDRIPRDLETICLKAMAKEPARRYSTADELARDLRRFLRSEPIHARRVGRMERLYRWSRRNPLIAGLISLAVLLLAGLAAVSTMAYFREQGRRTQETALRIDAQKSYRNEMAARQRETKARAAERKALTNLARAQAERVENEIRSARQSLVQAQMLLLGAAFERQDGRRTAELLRATYPQAGDADQRQFEWYYYFAQMHREQRTLLGHNQAVKTAVFSPDAKRLATGVAAQAIRLWDVETGRMLHRLESPSEWTEQLEFSADGQRLIAGGAGAVSLWEVATGKVLVSLDSRTPETVLPMYTDGRFVASPLPRDSSVIQLWKAEPGSAPALLSGHSGAVARIAFSADGRWLASIDANGQCKIWDSGSGLERQTLPEVIRRPTELRFSPHGAILAVANDFGEVQLWNTAAGTALATLDKHTGTINAIAFSADNAFIASGGVDRDVRVWEVTSGAEVRTFAGHTAEVISLAFSPDRKWVASASGDSTIRIWNVAHGRLETVLRGHAGSVNRVSFSGDGKLLVSAGDDATVRLWDVVAVTRPEELQVPEVASGTGTGASNQNHEIADLAYSSDGQTLAAIGMDGVVTLWDTASGVPHRQIRGHSASWNQLAFAAGSRTLPVCAEDNSIRLWDGETGAARVVVEPSGTEVSALSGAADGSRLAIAARSVIRVVNAATGATLGTLTGHKGYVDNVLFSPDVTRLVSTDDESTVRVWDLATFSERMKFNPSAYWAIALSPDGTFLAYSDDHLIKLVDLGSGEVRATLAGHSAAVMDLNFSPNGRMLASAAKDHTLKLWDLPSGIERATFSDGEPLSAVAFSPDGRTLASGHSSGRIRLWRTSPQAADQHMASMLAREFLSHIEDVPILKEEVQKLMTLNEADARAYLNSAAAGDAHRQLLEEYLRLAEPVRLQARQLAEGFVPDADLLNAEAWRIVAPGSGSQDTAAIARAVRYASEACRLNPGNGDLLNTLGVAKYRGGRHEEALKTLQASEEAHSASGPKALSDRAFQALALFRLGRLADARALLEKDRSEWELGDEESARACLEAEETIAPWGPLLVRARQDRAAGRYVEAAGHLQEALEQGCAVPPVIRDHIDLLAQAGRWQETAKALTAATGRISMAGWGTIAQVDKVIAADPRNTTLLLWRARRLASERDWNRCLADARQAIELGTRTPESLSLMATSLAELERWTEAAPAFVSLADHKDLSASARADQLYHASLCSLAANDLPAYRATCATILDQFAQPDRGVLILGRVCYACVPGPGAVADQGRLVEVARLSAQDFPYNARLLGAALFRAGRYDEVEAEFEISRASQPAGGQRAWDFYFLAMTCHHLEQTKQANAYLQQAQDWSQTHRDSVPWPERVEMRALRREADALFSGDVH